MHQESTSQYPGQRHRIARKRKGRTHGTPSLSPALFHLQESKDVMEQTAKSDGIVSGGVSVDSGHYFRLLGRRSWTIRTRIRARAGDLAGQHSQSTEISPRRFHRVAVSHGTPIGGRRVAEVWVADQYQRRRSPRRTHGRLPCLRIEGRGKTFHDTNLMPFLRQNTEAIPSCPPSLRRGCTTAMRPGSPSATTTRSTPADPCSPHWRQATGIPRDRGAQQGRALVTVSRDKGKNWSPPTFGIRISNFDPGQGSVAPIISPVSRLLRARISGIRRGTARWR